MTVTTPATRTSRLPVAVAALSLLYGVLGVIWLLGADWYPFGPSTDGDKVTPLAFLPEQVGAGLVALLGVLGVPAALSHLRTGWTPTAYRPLLTFTAVEAIFFGLLAPSMSLVVIAGYLLVLVGVPVALGFVVAGALRQQTTRALLLVLLGFAAAVQLTTGLFDWKAFQGLGSGLASVPERVGSQPLFVFGAFLLGAGWAVLGVRALRNVRGRCARCGRPGARWTQPELARRWGFWATVVAALCPMPYALLRMTWLLPSPIGLGVQASDLEAQPGIRLFGLGLGLIALTSGIVTLGLIRPWGEIWPRWVPFLAGQPVALKAALIPAATAATLLLVGSVSLVPMLWVPEESLLTNVGHLLLFPFPLWGASLALATAAYYYRRRDRCTGCAQG
ncbi:hypothetical protein BWI15_36105 [Kribbella sp. ALI-6-A]|uniref:hypothetical protein n=1 Tax=Kribbella sp. ALI-6-A TaxID=1933817 RepID=UPI00097BC914|nr:hypothetical protein [Kribbella sp. ALI-6-A]ONI68419.1 hypothetical protein BWI15_36105 [Kribbella sp. ALI-6-A]